MTILQDDLQARIAEAARRYVDTKWTKECGDFVRQVLAEQGREVTGRLRDFGNAVVSSERKPGEVILFYRFHTELQANYPVLAAILTGHNSYAFPHFKTIRERMFEASEELAPTPTVMPIGDGRGTSFYAIIRRVS